MTDPIVAAAEFLTAQLPWLRHARADNGEAWAVSVFAEIRDCAAKLRSLTDGPSEYHYLGPCGAPVVAAEVEAGCPVNCECHNGPYYACSEPGGCGSAGCGRSVTTGESCEGDVRWRPGTDHGVCRTCGATFDLDDRQKWLDQVRREWLYSAAEIADAYPEVNENTIRTWIHRGQLTAHGEYAGGPLLKLGEVLDLAAESKARREEERARRAAARTTAQMGA